MGSEHGGLNYKQLRKQGISPESVLDFSVSINPAPLPEGMLQKIRSTCITRYPDTNCNLLKEAISSFNQMETPDNILVVNGTSQGIFLISQAFLEKDDTVAIVSPTYSEYEDACSLKTDRIQHIHMKKEDEFAFPVADIISHISRKKPKLLWICSPNNPTGSYLTEMEFEAIRISCIKSNTLFILDEAYICFVGDGFRYNTVKENVIVLRSMTKDFGIPGLRLGYLLGEPETLSSIARWQPDWSIGAAAQDAGIAGFEAVDYYRRSWKKTVRMVQALKDDLDRLGYRTFPTYTNFFLMETQDSLSLQENLWKDLILVRDCRSFGLENFIRIGINTEEANKKLYSCIKGYTEK